MADGFDERGAGDAAQVVVAEEKVRKGTALAIAKRRMTAQISHDLVIREKRAGEGGSPRCSYSVCGPRWLAGQRKVECRASSREALGPGPAAVPINDAPDIGQADPQALKLERGVETLEHAE